MTLGKFTLIIATRPDNPAFPVYRIFIGKRFIGNQFSYPSVSDCEWIERNRGVYATESAWTDKADSAGRPGCRARGGRYGDGGSGGALPKKTKPA